MPATIPDDIAQALAAGGPAPAGLSADEQRAWDQLDFFYKNGLGYANEMALRPQTLYGIADSPIGLAAWMLDHDAAQPTRSSHASSTGKPEGLTTDDILDNVTLYWLTNTAVSSARLYWESKLAFFAPKGVADPDRRERLPRRDLRRAAELGRDARTRNLIHFNKVAKGTPLRGVGAAGAVHRRDASGLQGDAPVGPRRPYSSFTRR